jgi:phosphoglycerate dehydrogenase-like enzyme
MKKLVMFPAVDDARCEKIAAAAGAMRVVNAISEAEATREIADADAFFGKLTPELLAAAGRLAWVQAPTASLEHYLFPVLVAHPCQLTNMRGISADVIAEHVLAYLLCFSRNLHRYIRQQSQARWSPIGGEAERSDFKTGPGVVNAIDRAHPTLSEATLGIVGLGHIGREVARRASFLGMRVVAVDPRAEAAADAGVTECWPLDALPRLLAASDYVVICAPHTPVTERMFRRAQLEQMKRTAILVNVGRGAIVDLDDLTAALTDRTIAGAALDVFEREPLPPDHPLWRLENAILTPHVAGFGPRVAERHLALLVENIGRFVRGEPLANVVDKVAWY